MHNALTAGKRHLFLAVSALCLIAMQPSMAQQPSPVSPRPFRQVSLELRQKSLADICKTLSEQLGRGILVDGEPQRKQADVVFSGAGREALDKVADAFDYTWSEGKHGILLLRKRFTRPDELPQFTRAEWRQTARDILDSIAIVDFDHERFPKVHYLIRLFHAFTPDQIQQLQAGQILYVRDLPAEQRDLVRQWDYNSTFAPAYDAWQQLFAELDAMPASSLQQRERFATLPKRFSPATNGEVREITFNYLYRDRSGENQAWPLAFKTVPVEKKP